MKQQTKAVSKLPPDPRSNVAADAVPDARVDARIERTRLCIDRAFVQLLTQRTYRSLSVHDITRKADIGRATFYAHFESKDELLRSQFTRVILPIVKARPDTPYLLDCTALFEHILTAPQLFRNIMSGGEGSGARVIRTALEEHVQTLLTIRTACANEVPQELLARFVVSTLLAVIIHALQSKAAESPQQLQARFARLAGSGLAEPR